MADCKQGEDRNRRRIQLNASQSDNVTELEDVYKKPSFMTRVY